jgi:hypothetical protein
MKGKKLVAAVGLLFLFMACERDIAGGFENGKKVEILLSTNITNYHTADDIVRSVGIGEPESTTIYINDSIYLQTTLVPDLEDDLRAHEPFIDGQKLCFSAYKTDGTKAQVGATAVYTYSDTEHKWIPDGEPLGVVPDNSTVYRFVAYSHFGGKTTPSETDIDLAKDLVWGFEEKKIEDTEASRTVSINMLHKFSRVKVRVKSGIDGVKIKDLGDVEIEGGNWTAFTPFDGSFGTVGSVTQGIDFDTDLLPDEEIESEQRLIFPVAAAPTKVKFGTIEISATAPFSDQTVRFNSALEAGVSYVLVVDVRRCVWARSNIYWDDAAQQLTFVTDVNDLSKQGYQGVFFRWGSLVGISPAKTGTSDSFSGSTPIYVPVFDAVTPTSSTWKATTGSAMANDTDFPDVKSNWTAWGATSAGSAAPATQIPYMDGRYAKSDETTYNRNNTYVGDAALNLDTTYQGFRGDICQYLSTKTEVVSGDWRLPTSNEFGLSNTNFTWSLSTTSPDGWQKGAGLFETTNGAGYPNGRADFLSDQQEANFNPNKNTHAANSVVLASGINKTMGNVVFPASGDRDYTGGSLSFVSLNGVYWSCSPSSATNGYSLYFITNSVRPYEVFNRSFGFSVRCVQNLD